MMKKIFFAGLSAAALFMAGCSGNLEDTYKDYSGDGPIRYLGKCEEVTLQTGWHWLKVNWSPSLDASVKKIKIVCQSGDYKRDTTVNADKTSWQINNLPDGSFQIDVYSMDADGNMSLPAQAFGRPYSETHELYNGFSRVVTKHYFVKKNIVLIFDKWQETFDKMQLSYSNTAGQAVVKEITKEIIDAKYLLILDVDPDKAVKLFRWGRIADAPDVLRFGDVDLGKERVFTTDMKLVLAERHGIVDLTEAEINGLTSLEIDYNMSSLEDVLYFPNLTKLSLGKNRYFYQPYINQFLPFPNAAKLVDHEKSNFMLKVAQQLCGLVIENYQNRIMYSEGTFAAGLTITDYTSTPQVPPSGKNYLNTAAWTISDLAEENNTYLQNLLDNTQSTIWESAVTTSLKIHEIVIDMQQEHTINGFKIVQAVRGAYNSADPVNYYASIISIQTSVDQIVWTNVGATKSITIGKTNGEITFVDLPAARSAHYIKVTFSDGVSGTTNKTYLADIAVY